MCKNPFLGRVSSHRSGAVWVSGGVAIINFIPSDVCVKEIRCTNDPSKEKLTIAAN